jgi:hypothetical protein
MSQYPPSPYSSPSPQPNLGYYAQSVRDPYGSLLNPCKVAGGAMIAVGALMLLGGLCIGIAGLTGPEQLLQGMVEGARQPEMTVSMMRIGLAVVGVIGFIASLVMLVLGFFIWRGSVPATVVGIVITSLLLLMAVGNSLFSLPNAAGMNGAELVGFGCVTLFTPLIFLVLVVLLVYGLKAARRHHAAVLQYQTQYWQYQQQQQMYAQPSGYGYAQAPQQTPEPPPQSPPPDPGVA